MFGPTSTVKPAAAHKDRVLVKHVYADVQSGLEYANLPENEGVDTGALKWGEWAQYPYIITHKGQTYVRLYVTEGTARAVYFVDGAQCERDTFLSYLTPSAAKSSRPVGGTIAVKAENLQVL